MTIERLIEFAKNGSKNKDELDTDVGFVVSRKPARQWFNYLFNMLSLKVNEIIDLDPIARVEIINDLTTNNEKKPLSAAMGKKLQEEKIAISDLVNDLVTGGTDKALTAEAAKLLIGMFGNILGASGRKYFPNPDNPSKPFILQWGQTVLSYGNQKAVFNYPVAVTERSIVFMQDLGSSEALTSNWKVLRQGLTSCDYKLVNSTDSTQSYLANVYVLGW